MTNAAGDWDRVKQVFQSALERSPETRPAFLDEACGDDRSLRAEVESLLRAHEEAGSFAEHAAVDDLAGRPLQRGDRLGPYDIVELVGAGGMGDVYRARDSKLGRDVAIKVLPLFTTNADRLARFEREGGMLASLNHPHLLTVYDVGDVDGRPYLVTEFVDGGTLKTWALAADAHVAAEPSNCWSVSPTAWPPRTPRASSTGTSSRTTSSSRRTATPSSPTSGWQSCSRASIARRQTRSARRARSRA